MRIRNADSIADKAIGGRLRSFRRSRGMSQQTLGQSLGVTFQQVQKYENGKNRLSGSRLMVVCEVLKVTPAQLLGFDGKAATEAPSSFDALKDVHVNRLVASLGKLPEKRRRALVQAFEMIASA